MSLIKREWTSEEADRWTKDYSVRDSAVKGGISPTRVISEQVVMQNVVTFYRPVSVPTASNAYKSMRSLAIIQDVLMTQQLGYQEAEEALAHHQHRFAWSDLGMMNMVECHLWE